MVRRAAMVLLVVSLQGCWCAFNGDFDYTPRTQSTSTGVGGGDGGLDAGDSELDAGDSGLDGSDDAALPDASLGQPVSLGQSCTGGKYRMVFTVGEPQVLPEQSGGKYRMRGGLVGAKENE